MDPYNVADLWQMEAQPPILQLRSARHQPRTIRLEDGTTLEEPAGVEGYLIQHKSAGSAKEHVYVSSHDGESYAGTH